MGPLGLFGPPRTNARSASARNVRPTSRRRSGARSVGHPDDEAHLVRSKDLDRRGRIGDRVAEGRGRARRSAQGTVVEPARFRGYCAEGRAAGVDRGADREGDHGGDRSTRRRSAAELHEGRPGHPGARRAIGPAGHRPHRPALRRPDVGGVLPRARPARAGPQPRRRLGQPREPDRRIMVALEGAFADLDPALDRRLRRRQLDARGGARRGQARACRSRTSRRVCAASTGTMPEEINRRRHGRPVATSCSSRAPRPSTNLAREGDRPRSASTSSATR